MNRLHCLILLCVLLPGHRSSRDIVVTRSLTTAVNDSSENVVLQNKNNKTQSEDSLVLVYLRPPESSIRPQDTISDRNSQAASRNQYWKSPRIFLSRSISKSQYPKLSYNSHLNINSSNMQHNSLDENKTMFKNEEINEVEANTIEPANRSGTAEDSIQSSTEIPKTNQKTDSNSTNINVSLEDRASFVGDKCPSGHVKVDGKCVPVKE
ncbi:hypothetical protein RR48_09322 [Papilio machaon]|uniref:Uncharacterized protein n=1 Tax=Papilio machaon TaxID=76193 RepID=A0A194RDD8_PAPMA|nr:hypothetical protein RR48_09322 [Papilio machaon]